MAKIKTRDAVKGTIKAIDKAAVASERMKAAYAKTKEKAEQGYYAEESSATEYAADKVSYASERIAGEGAHQLNRQGQKSVQTTKENIIKAKDKVEDFKGKRAVKTAEKQNAQAAAERNGSQPRHGAASRSPAVNNFMSCHRFNLIRCHKSAHFPVMLSIAYTIVQSYLFASSQDSIFHATVGNCLTIPDMADHIHLRNCA